MEDQGYPALGLLISKNKDKYSKIKDGLVYFFQQLFLVAIAYIVH